MLWILHFNYTPWVEPTSNFFTFCFNELIGPHYTKRNAGLKAKSAEVTCNEPGQATPRTTLVLLSNAYYGNKFFLLLN